MKRFAVLPALILASLAMSACSDTSIASWDALGTPGHIKCYSGDKLFYEGASTGKIQTVSHSDGWEFKDAATGKLVRVSGTCLIEN